MTGEKKGKRGKKKMQGKDLFLKLLEIIKEDAVG